MSTKTLTLKNRKIQMMSINLIKPYENNPRKNDRAVPGIVESIKKYGFNVPITVDKNLVIATGHTRYKAALELGLTEVPVIVLDDLSENEIKAWRLVDNKTAEKAKWDEEALHTELEVLLGVNVDLSIFGFDGRDKLLYGVEDDNFNPVVPAKPKAKRGDIYQLGEHRLMCGDSTNEEDMQLLMNGQLADLVVTDPPYNVDYDGSSTKNGATSVKDKPSKRVSDRILNDHMDERSFRAFLSDVFKQMKKCLRRGGVYYIFHSDSHESSFIRSLESAGLESKHCLVWVKNSFTLGRQDYQQQHEPALYGWKEGAGHYFINDRGQATVIELTDEELEKLTKAELIAKIKEIQTSVIREDKPLHNDLHPTMKPVKLIARLVANSSKEGDIVLDQFGGSGSTLIACEDLGRKAYLMELDPGYVDVIIKRYEEKTGQKAVLIRKGKKK